MTRVSLPCGRLFLIDEQDLPLLEGRVRFSEQRGRTRYVRTRLRGQQGSGIFLHRLILPDAEQVDHINGDGLDNRRSNLRPCTWQQNLRNTGPRRPHKRYKGVYFNRAEGVWYAQLRLNRRCFHGGRHKTEEAAARAYDAMATEHFGEFAWLNFPPITRYAP